MNLVGGVIFEKSVLLSTSEHETPNVNDSSFQLRPGVPSLLRKLRHSKLRTGISYGSGLSTDKVSALKRVAAEYLCDCFLFDASKDGAVNELTKVCDDIGGSILYVVCNDKDAFHGPNCHWLMIVVGVEGVSADKNSSTLYINKLEELPLTICHLNKKAIGNNAVIVGYVMKPSREEDFAKRGALPMNPTPNGLIFQPITFEISLSSQLQEVDVVLHKATDEIKSIELGSSPESSNITYTTGMQELQRFMEHHTDFLAIDPLDNIYPVLDRLNIQLILLELHDLSAEGRCTIRGPHFLKVDDFSNPDLAQRLSESKLSLPSIVKPQVACGVADAHSMAIVFGIEDFTQLSVPLPAVIQEYVNHSSTLFKFYVLGENVFHAVKKSTPNSVVLMKLYEKNGLQPIMFDSLKSLPTDTDNQHSGDAVSYKVDDLDLDLVKDAAKWLAKKLDLTIFGFDVVIQEGTGDHVIVDVNYLPSFKEVHNDIAIPAFWDAIKRKLESKKMKRATTVSSA